MTVNRGVARMERGDIAQLGERCVRIAEVGGSNPPISTSKDGKLVLREVRRASLIHNVGAEPSFNGAW